MGRKFRAGGMIPCRGTARARNAPQPRRHADQRPAPVRRSDAPISLQRWRDRPAGRAAAPCFPAASSAPGRNIRAPPGRLRQYDPRLLARGEDVDVRRQPVGLVERAHAHEADGIAGPRVVAPQRNAAGGAARDLLAATAVGRRQHDVRFAAHELDAVGLDHRVQRERRARLALAPAAMTAMHEQRPGRHPVAHAAAIASAFQRISAVGHCVASVFVVGAVTFMDASLGHGGPLSSTVLPSGSVT